MARSEGGARLLLATLSVVREMVGEAEDVGCTWENEGLCLFVGEIVIEGRIVKKVKVLEDIQKRGCGEGWQSYHIPSLYKGYTNIAASMQAEESRNDRLRWKVESATSWRCIHT